MPDAVGGGTFANILCEPNRDFEVVEHGDGRHDRAGRLLTSPNSSAEKKSGMASAPGGKMKRTAWLSGSMRCGVTGSWH